MVKPDSPRVTGLRMKHRAECDDILRLSEKGPGQPPHEPMDRVVMLGLVEGRGRCGSLERVATVTQPVGPWREHLSPTVCAPAGYIESVDDVVPCHVEDPERGADFGGDHAVIPVTDLVLLT